MNRSGAVEGLKNAGDSLRVARPAPLALVGHFALSIVHDRTNPLNTIGIEILSAANSIPEVRADVGREVREQWTGWAGSGILRVGGAAGVIKIEVPANCSVSPTPGSGRRRLSEVRDLGNGLGSHFRFGCHERHGRIGASIICPDNPNKQGSSVSVGPARRDLTNRQRSGLP